MKARKAGEGTLFKKGARFYLRVRTPEGGRKDIATGCTSEKEARDWAKSYASPVLQAKPEEAMERIRQIKASRSSVDFAKAWEIFVKTPRTHESGEEQASRNASQWQDFSAWGEAQGLSHVAQITPTHAAEYLDELSSSGRFAETRAGIAPAALSNRSRNKYHLTLKAVFAASMDSAGINKNPFNLPKKANDCEEREAFSIEELRTILDATESRPMLRQLVTLAVCTGLRTGDACRLTWDEVDLRSSIAWIHKKTSKTGKAVKIPVMPKLRSLLEEQPQGQRGESVFPDLANQYDKDETRLSKSFGALLDSLGIERSRRIEDRSRPHVFKDLHSLRHTFVYLAAESGIPLAIVQGIVGHASPKMTALYADHATDKAKAEAMKKLPDFFSSAPEEKKKAAPEVIEAEIVPPAEVKAKEAAAMLRKALKAVDPEKIKDLVKQALKKLEA